MEWNLTPILNYDGKKMPIDVSVELSGYPDDDFQILESVVLKGEIVNIGGCLEFSAEGSTKIKRTCDRCAEDFIVAHTFSIEERLKKADALEQENADPDIIVIEGSSIDLSEIVYTSLYSSIPSKALCDDECKGLCSVCGQNLNNGTCSCDERPTDPRFDVLDQLL